MGQCPCKDQPNPPQARFVVGHHTYLCKHDAQPEPHTLDLLVVLQSAITKKKSYICEFFRLRSMNVYEGGAGFPTLQGMAFSVHFPTRKSSWVDNQIIKEPLECIF